MKANYYGPAQMYFALAALAYGFTWLVQIIWAPFVAVHSYVYEGLYWITQSALIGAIADWFAVSALFRKPLGITYHTAILPRKKALIVNQVTALVENFLLKKEVMAAKIESLSILAFLDKVIDSEKGRQFLRKNISIALGHLNNEMLEKHIIDKVRQGLLSLEISPFIKDFFEKQGFAYFLKRINELGRRHEVEDFMADELDRIINEQGLFMRFGLWVGELFDIVNTRDMARALHHSLQDLLQKAVDDKNGREYKFLEGQWKKLVDSLQKGGEGERIVKSVYSQWAEELPLEELWCTHIGPLVDRYVAQDDQGYSEGGLFLEEKLHHFWFTYGQRDLYREPIEATGKKILLTLAEANHSVVGKIVRQVLDQFDEGKLSQFIEDKFGEDLCFIRVNGTLVGALLGLVLWLFMGLYDIVLDGIRFL